MEKQIINLPELKFTIVAEPFEYHVEYTIYDMEGYDEQTQKPVWHRAGAASSPNSVDTIEEAEPYLHGSVKWDGCSNWHFDEQDRVMLHGCGKEDIQRFGDVMAYCWDLTSTLCPHWC